MSPIHAVLLCCAGVFVLIAFALWLAVYLQDRAMLRQARIRALYEYGKNPPSDRFAP